VVPMHARDVTIGTLALFDWDSRLSLDEDAIAWMGVVADRIAMSVEHVQCHSAARERLQRLSAIRNVGLALASSDDSRLTMQVILEQLSGRLRVDAADILLVDEHNHELYPAASIGFHSGSPPDFRLPISDVRSAGGQPDLPRQLRLRPGFAREGFQTHQAAPLISRGKFLGVIEVFYRSVYEVDREWTDFLESMATIAAIAIDNLGMDAQLKRVDAGVVRPAASPRPRLSEVEWRIVALVSDGATNRDIASRLHLSESAIKFHVRRILDAVGVDNRTELARKATQQGWL
jgi:DNA-binding CsgD family transcriptional regulator